MSSSNELARPRRPQGNRTTRWAVTGGIGLAGALGLSAFILMPGAGASPSDKVTICHATSSTSNPYTVNTINTSSIDEAGNKYLNGHGDHTGPVFSSGMASGWGDVIPPFTDPVSGNSFPGYNWDAAGQAIVSAGCTPPDPSPSPTPTETSASPTPTETSATPTPTETSATPTPTETSATPTPTSTPTTITTSPAPTPTSTPTTITTSPAPVTTSPAPVTTSPAPVTTSPAPVTTSPAPTPTSITTSPAPAVTSGGYPQGVPAGGGPGDPMGQSSTGASWLWMAVLALLGLSIVSFRQLVWGRDDR